MKRLLFTLLFTGILSAQTVVTPAALTFSPDAVAAMNSWFLTQIVNGLTTLTVALTPGETSMTVKDGTQLAVNQEFLLDGEAINPSAIVGNVVTITRADLGTTAAAHAINSNVSVLKYKSIKNYCKQAIQQEVAAIMSMTTFPSGATQDAVIATAQATKATAVAGAIQ